MTLSEDVSTIALYLKVPPFVPIKNAVVRAFVNNAMLWINCREITIIKTVKTGIEVKTVFFSSPSY